MPRFPFLLGLVGLIPAAHAAPPGRRPPPTVAPTPAPAAVNPEPLRAAERAVCEGLPTVAIARLRPFLAGNPTPAERRAGGLLLARALLETGDARGARSALPAGDDAPDAAFLRAGVGATLGQWDAALADYARAGDGPAARFGRAECLRALGRGPEADGLLAGLTGDAAFGVAATLRRVEMALDAGKPAAAEAALREGPGALTTVTGRFLLGRAQLDAGRAAEAEETLAALGAGPLDGFTGTTLARTHLLLARARVTNGRVAEAAAGLEHFVDLFPRHPRLGEFFAAAEELRGGDRALPPTDETLARWRMDAAEPWRGGFAALTLARARRAAGRGEDAAAILETFPAAYPGHPASARAGAERAAMLLADARPTEARAALAGVRALPGADAVDFRVQVDALEVRASLALGDFPAAAARLEALAETPGLPPARVEAALAGAALARLRARDEEGFEAGRAALARRFPNGDWRGSLPLEEGLLRAAARDGAGAAAVLRAFVDAVPAPAPARLAAARLALAELRFLDNDPDAARAELRFVASADPAGDPGARADWLAILAADAPGAARDEVAAITRARAFLARRPNSPLTADVHLKLGEIYYRREDYPDAQTELELVPATAGMPVYEAARYLAGRAALGAQSPAGANRAVELFEDVVRLNGTLRPAARLRQAETLRDRLGKPADALVLYDAVLAGTTPPPSPAVRCIALIGKAEGTLRVSPGDRDRALEAARLLGTAAAVPDAPLPLRRQALDRQGAALERAGLPEEAVAAYAEALDATGNPDGGGEDDLTWFYRAGFAAARLLRAGGQWAQAIAVYEKLTRTDGPLRAEAESQARALRLEHFIWEREGGGAEGTSNIQR